MAKGHKPVAGSRGYWRRKRAIRIYSRMNKVPKIKTDGCIPLAFAGYKAGMTQAIFTDTSSESPTSGKDISRPVTIIECPNLHVYGAVFYKKTTEGLKSVGAVLEEKPDKDVKRKTSIPKKIKGKIEDFEKNEKVADVRILVHSKPKETGIGKKTPELLEIPLSGKLEEKMAYVKNKLGQEITANDMFKLGEYVDVKGVTKGKGFQGPVKRFGVKIRGRKHQKKRRHIGVLSARNVAKVLPNSVPYAGQYGFHNRTEYNKRVLKFGEDGKEVTPKGGFINYGIVKSKYIILEGSIPGPKKRFVILRKGTRAKKELPIDVKNVVLESQQG